MNDTIAITNYQEQERELVDILIDSDLYLELDLTERRRLIRFLLAAYFPLLRKVNQ